MIRKLRALNLAVLLLGVVFCVLAVHPPARAARARSLGLQDMAQRAGRIFVGQCTDRAVGVDPQTQVPFTEYTFEVITPVKGVPSGTTSFRVPGTPARPRFAYLPAIEPGDVRLLFLYPESAAGFSTPMGLDQGFFRVEQGENGRSRVANGRRNVGLLNDVPAAILERGELERNRRGPLELETLLSVLQGLQVEERP